MMVYQKRGSIAMPLTSSHSCPEMKINKPLQGLFFFLIILAATECDHHKSDDDWQNKCKAHKKKELHTRHHLPRKNIFPGSMHFFRGNVQQANRKERTLGTYSMFALLLSDPLPSPSFHAPHFIIV